MDIRFKLQTIEKPQKQIALCFWSIPVLKVTLVEWSISKMIRCENGHQIQARGHLKPSKNICAMFLVHFNFEGYCCGAVHFQLGNDQM